jgi:hypothetical protein
VVCLAPAGADVVSTYDDPPDEILDLGRPGRREERASPRSLPPMHIDERPPAEDDDRADRPRWWLWAVLAIAVAAGLVVGVLGSNARRDAAELAAAENEVDLIAGTPILAPAPGIPLQVPIYNAGPFDVELLWLRPVGWTAEETTPSPITLSPDTWVTVPVRAVPDCSEFGGSAGDTLEARVRTQAREREVSLPFPVHDWLPDAQVAACGVFVGAFVEEVELLPARSADALSLRLRLRAYDPEQSFTLTDVEASAPGFAMTHASVPVQFEPGGARSFPLDVTWQVADCGTTRILNDVTLGLEFEDQNGDRQSDGAALPGRGVAELARFGVSQCGQE